MIEEEVILSAAKKLALEAIDNLRKPENRHLLIIALAQEAENTPVHKEDVDRLAWFLGDVREYTTELWRHL